MVQVIYYLNRIEGDAINATKGAMCAFESKVFKMIKYVYKIKRFLFKKTFSDLLGYLRALFIYFMVKIFLRRTIITNGFCYFFGFPEIRGRGKIKMGRGARIGRNVKIIFDDDACQGALYLGRCSLTENDVIYAPRGGKIVIGDNSFVGPRCMIQSCRNSEVLVGNFVMLAAGVMIFGSNHIFDRRDIPMRLQGERADGIYIADDVWIGTSGIILDGVFIENGAVVAAGAVVRTLVPAGSIYGGVPAKQIGRR